MPSSAMMFRAAERSIWYSLSARVERGRHHDGVAGVNPHRVKVLHGADGDGGALVVPHHLKLDLFPARDILFDEDLGDGGAVAGRSAPTSRQLFLVVGNAAAAAAQGEGGPDNDRVANAVGNGNAASSNVIGGVGGDDGLADVLAMASLNSCRSSALSMASALVPMQADAVLLQEAFMVQLHGDGQAGLPAQAGQQAVRAALSR